MGDRKKGRKTTLLFLGIIIALVVAISVVFVLIPNRYPESGEAAGAARTISQPVVAIGEAVLPPFRTVIFGEKGDIPLVGNWNGQADLIGLYRPDSSTFILKNSNDKKGNFVTIVFGSKGDVPLIGDWNGDGKKEIGLYRPISSTFILKRGNTQESPHDTIPFGVRGNIPLIGDWDGDGIDEIGVYNPSSQMFSLRHSNTQGSADVKFAFGAPGDIVMVGDWDGDGFDTIGLFRQVSSENQPFSRFILSNTRLEKESIQPTPSKILDFKKSGGIPVVGKWGDNGEDIVGLYHAPSSTFLLMQANKQDSGYIAKIFGVDGDIPLVGDWDGTGKAVVGVYRPQSSSFFLEDSGLGTEVWFFPAQYQNTEGKYFPQYLELFTTPNIKWPEFEKSVDVFKFQFDLMGSKNFDDFVAKNKLLAELEKNDAFRKLSNKGISIALEIFIGDPGNPDPNIACDSTRVAEMAGQLVDRIRQKGGHVKYINLVEVLYEMLEWPGRANYYRDITFGKGSDAPIAGNWGDDGFDTIGLYRAGKFFLKKSNTNEARFNTLSLGTAGDVPLVGDWNGDHKDEAGIFRPQTSQLILKSSLGGGSADFIVDVPFAEEDDRPIVGDWNGDGFDTIGFYRGPSSMFILSNTKLEPNAQLVPSSEFAYGLPGDIPVVGDWNGDGKDTVGIYRGESSGPRFDLSNLDGEPAVDNQIYFDVIPGSVPVVGDWDHDGKDNVGLFSSYARFVLTDTTDAKSTCRRFGYTGKEVARETSRFIKEMEAHNPEIRVGADIPVGAVKKEDVRMWIKELKRLGTPLPYALIEYSGNSKEMAAYWDLLSGNNVGVGILMFRTPSDDTSAQYYSGFMQTTEDVKLLFEGKVFPRKVSYEIWGRRKTAASDDGILPENSPYTLTYTFKDSWDTLQ